MMRAARRDSPPGGFSWFGVLGAMPGLPPKGGLCALPQGRKLIPKGGRSFCSGALGHRGRRVHVRSMLLLRAGAGQLRREADGRMCIAPARCWRRYTLYIMYGILPETKKVRGPIRGRAPILLCSLHYIMQERTPQPDRRGTLSSQNDPLRVLLSSDESESDSMTRTVSVVWV